MNFGNLFKECRKIAKLRQKHMTQELKISQSAVSKIEKGSLVPGADVFVRFLKMFEIGHPAIKGVKSAEVREIRERINLFWRDLQ